MKILKKSLFFFFLIILFICFSKSVYADSNFSTDYNVTYLIYDNSNTRVTINVTLTNLTAKYYSPSYKISVGFKNINNVSGYDANGKLNIGLSTSASGTDLSFDFNKAVTGLNNQQNFSVGFDTNEVAQSIGNVWDVNIPGISPASNFSSFNSTIIYPSFLGKPAFIKPNIPGKQALGNQISFSKDELGKSGISLAFGAEQIYEFNLKYHLKNPNLFPIRTEIALPPNTNYQDVLINSIYPQPVNVKLDTDGNWLAEYILSPSQLLNIVVNGKAKVMLDGRGEILTLENQANYLKSQKYWEVKDSNIQSKANNLKSAEQIYQFVLATLNYDFNRVVGKKPRLGAAKILSDPSSAICLEFTDLFIALARANGIPAREIDGFAFTTNSQVRPLSLSEDVLHAWPEYYDYSKNTWVMVDPTWGNTTGGVDYFNTFDFDHITFAIHGTSSIYPVPAGGYKSTANSQKDVEVFLSKDFVPSAKTDININIKNPILFFLGNKGEIKIANLGNAIIDEAKVQIYSQNLKFSKNSFTLSKIPPYGFITLPFEFSNRFSLTSKDEPITIQIGNNNYIKKIKILPFYLNVWFLGGVFVVILIICIFIITKRPGSIPVSQQKK